MTILNNVINLKQTRVTLRKNQTKPESVFWSKVRLKQFLQLKFRRQHSIGCYVLDFYCSELKICVEIDGDSHFEEKAFDYDKIRTEYLQVNGIKVIRFTNKEIIENIEGVLYELEKYIKTFLISREDFV